MGCTAEMMERCRQLKQEHNDCWINTHISENPSEIRTARDHFPDCDDYTHVHAKHGLLGPKFIAGHGVWLSNDEFRRFSKAGAAIAFCPLSNLFLGSGLFRLGRATDPDHRVRIALGSDMGGGNAFSLVRVLEEAYKVGMCNNTMLDGSVNPREQDLAEAERNKLGPYRAFYLATLGGAAPSTSTTCSATSTGARRPTSSPSTGTPASWPCAGTSRSSPPRRPGDDRPGGPAAVRRHGGRRRPQRRRNLGRRPARVQEARRAGYSRCRAARYRQRA